MIRLRGTILRIASLSRLILACALFSLLFVPVRAFAAVPPDEAAKMLPATFDSNDFQARGPARALNSGVLDAPLEDFGATSAAARTYALQSGALYTVTLVKTRSDSGAYALLTRAARWMREHEFPQVTRLDATGTAALAASQGPIAFFKGATFVLVDTQGGKSKETGRMAALAQLIAGTLDRGDGDIPVLVKHLPDWERARESAAYALSLDGLLRVVGQQPVLEAVSFEGGAEAVTADYGPSRLVIVEHTTPQIATDSDARITERIKQLQGAGQPVPSAYRRVGNYSVFVFNAPDERAAAQLMDQVNYEQVVQWLGANPYILQQAQREYVNTMGGTILAVIKASGLSLIVCFGIGGLVGALVFQRRRAQAAAVDAYSDAGGMLRLNIDEMTRQTDPGRLLGRGEG
jgi:hypothetical protein